MQVSRLLRLDWRAPTTQLAAFLLFNQFVLGLICHVTAPKGWLSSSWQFTRNILIGHGGADSWHPMSIALRHLRENPDEPLYTTILLGGETKFQYPPMSLPIYEAVNSAVLWLVPNTENMDPYSARGLVMLAGICLVIMGIFTALILARRLNTSPNLLILGMGVCAALTFFPLTFGAEIGQIQTWMSLAFAISLYCLLNGQKRVSGALLGFLCLIKPHYGLFVIWGALRRDWDFVIPLLGVCVGAALYTVFLYGFGQHFDYLHALSYMSRHGEGFFHNQSINGLMNRLVTLYTTDTDWNLIARYTLPPYNPIVHVASTIATVVFVATGLFASRRDMVLSFCIMTLSVTMASPIAWTHHYGVALPIYAIAFAALLDRPKALIWLAVSYALTSQVWNVTQFLADTPANIVQSYSFFGFLILLGLLHWLAAGKPERPWSDAAAKARSWMAYRPGMG